MQSRNERLLVPSAVALISTFMTLWFSAGLNNSPFIWFDFLKQHNSKELSTFFGFLVGVGVTNLAFGYSAVAYSELEFRKKESRFIDFQRFMACFQLTSRNWEVYSRGISKAPENSFSLNSTPDSTHMHPNRL